MQAALLQVKLAIRRVVSSSFARSVVVVASGTAGAQAITFAFTPLLTRMYGPEAFGLQGLFTAVFGLAATAAGLGYASAIVLPERDEDALALGHLAIYLSAGLTVISIGLLILIFSDLGFGSGHATTLQGLEFMVPLALFGSTVAAAVNQWLLRKGQYALSARLAVKTSIATNCLKAGLGAIYPTAFVLVSANVLGLFLAPFIFFWRQPNSRDCANAIAIRPMSRLKRVAVRHRDFPLLRTPQNLLNVASQGIPLMLLTYYSGITASGFYSLAVTVLGVPAGLIGNSVSSVFYPHISEAIRRGRQPRPLIARATLAMAASGLIPFSVLVTVGPQMFSFVFGAPWEVAGTYAQVLAPWIFLQYVNKPAVAAIPSLGLQGGLLYYELVSTALKILALWVGFQLFDNSLIAVTLFSIAGCLAYLWLILWVLGRSGQPKRKIGSDDAT